MRWSEGELTGLGGVGLYRQAWLPEDEARAVVVLAHGLSEHSGRYAYVGARLAAEGYALQALDHRGHGRSDGPRSYFDAIEDLVADLDQLVLVLATADPGLPLFLLGHSMGGLVAAEYAIRHQERLAGLLLSAPLAALEAASPLTRIAAAALSQLMPRRGLIAIDSSQVSRDPEVVRAYRADPLVYHGKLPARTVSALASAIASLPERVAAVKLPTAIMYGSADRLAPPAGSLMLHSRIGAADKTLTAYDGLYHEILNEPERDQVLGDMCAWLRKHGDGG